jgi:deoxyadenosine/deoxycytidine kinase
MNTNIKIIISLEGNIGVGKSSLMKILQERLSDIAEFIYEPVEEWTEMKNKDGQNLLEVFYSDNKAWAYKFQNIAYITRMKRIVDLMINSKKKIIIMDRSLDGDKNTFTAMLKDSGDMDDIEYQAYNKWCSFFTDYLAKDIENKYIYLNSTSETSYARICQRERKEESNIPFEYINKLKNYHDKWLLNENTDKVLVLDVENDFVKNIKNREKIYCEIISYINKYL